MCAPLTLRENWTPTSTTLPDTGAPSMLSTRGLAPICQCSDSGDTTKGRHHELPAPLLRQHTGEGKGRRPDLVITAQREELRIPMAATWVCLTHKEWAEAVLSSNCQNISYVPCFPSACPKGSRWPFPCLNCAVSRFSHIKGFTSSDKIWVPASKPLPPGRKWRQRAMGK